MALRFEYVTDAAVNQSGFAVDDVEIVVDGETVLLDDSEADDDGWISEGFIRHANVLAQQWVVQLVVYGDETQVTRLLFGDQASGAWTIPLGPGTPRAVLTVSAMAPVTTELATYAYTLRAQP